MDPIIVGLFTFAAGLLLGHRLSLGREKRKEFNEAVQPIRKYILAEIDSPSAYRKPPSKAELDVVIHCMWWHQRYRFQKALNAFYEKKKEAEVRNELGEVLYGDATAIRLAAGKVLKHAKFR